ncbi:MAG: hypothetical protein WC862_01100 [Patescibacteria group bacterium]
MNEKIGNKKIGNSLIINLVSNIMLIETTMGGSRRAEGGTDFFGAMREELSHFDYANSDYCTRSWKEVLAGLSKGLDILKRLKDYNEDMDYKDSIGEIQESQEDFDRRQKEEEDIIRIVLNGLNDIFSSHFNDVSIESIESGLSDKVKKRFGISRTAHGVFDEYYRTIDEAIGLIEGTMSWAKDKNKENV